MAETDPLLKRSKDIDSMVPYWETVDDIVGGITTVRNAGEKHLPKFKDEDNDTYALRLKLATFTNIYRDIVEGIASKPFSQEVTLTTETVPDEITAFLENVDGAGNNLTVFSSLTFFNGINSAIDWIFIDYPPIDPTVRTAADQKQRNIRPYWSRIRACNVLDVRTIKIGSNETLVYIRFLEPGEPDHVREIIRGDDGSISWYLYKKTEKVTKDEKWGETRFVMVEQGVMTIDVIPVVPFVTGRREGNGWKIHPPMMDAADKQIDLYHRESALKYVSTLAGYPMLAGNGVTPDKDGAGKPKAISVGPSKVLYSPPDGQGNHGEWTYVEPNANTMLFLSEEIAKGQQQLRELGRQPLTAQSGNLTVVTTTVAASKARAAVKQWANQLKDSLENALVITAKWYGINYDPEVYVFTEFDDFIDGKDLDDLNTMYENNSLSLETYWYEKKRRGVLSVDFDAEKERKQLLNGLENTP